MLIWHSSLDWLSIENWQCTNFPAVFPQHQGSLWFSMCHTSKSRLGDAQQDRRGDNLNNTKRYSFLSSTSCSAKREKGVLGRLAIFWLGNGWALFNLWEEVSDCLWNSWSFLSFLSLLPYALQLLTLFFIFYLFILANFYCFYSFFFLVLIQLRAGEVGNQLCDA